MRIGKQVSKHYQLMYQCVPIWTFKILNGAKGYSVAKAYDIDPIFGSLVERGVWLLQIENDTLAALAKASQQNAIVARIIDCTKGWVGQLKYSSKQYLKGKMDIDEVLDAYDQYGTWFWLMSSVIAADNKTAAQYKMKPFTAEELMVINAAEEKRNKSELDDMLAKAVEGAFDE